MRRAIQLPELWVTRRTTAYKSSDSGEDTTDSGSGGTDSGGTDGDNENTDGDGDSGSGKEKDGKEGSEDRSELEKLQARMKAADKRAADAETELRKIQDKDKSELEIAQRRVKELEEKQEELAEQVREKALHHALLTDAELPASRWHDPEDVLLRAQRALKAEDITIEDDGTVKGATAWLKGLAKRSSHLLKPESKDGPENDDERGTGASGGQFNGKQKDKKIADEAALRKKYPALR